MAECLAWTATELLAAYRDKRLSPSEYVEALITHIARWEPHLNALYDYTPEALRAAARESSTRWDKGEPRGTLDGVPVTLKELIATRGTPIPHGTLAGEHPPAAEDAPPSARLAEDGALLIGKTTCPDYGMLSSGRSSFHGLTRNPWDLSCNPGGSSSGAAAAAGAGYGPLHVGTDIGGSIRLPAAWCGVVGFKPTLGRVPINPYYVGRCAGPMTRSVADAALMMGSLSRTDRRDAMRLPPERIDWRSLEQPMRDLRLGVMLDAGCGLPLDDEIAACVETAARHFEQAGATLVPLAPVMTRSMLDGLDRFWRARQWNELEALPPAERAKVLPEILAWADDGARQSGTDVVQGFEQTLTMRRVTEGVFAEVDAVLSPTTPVVAFPADWPSPTNDPQCPFEHIVYTVPWNMGEQPAISLNGGFSRGGMPLGVQLITARFNDALVLRLAHALERWVGPVTQWPAPPA